MAKEDPMIEALEKAKPLLSKFTFGSVIGYCSGMAAQKIGKAIAVVAGLSFIALQSAVYSGYVDVDWKKVQGDAVAKIDAVRK